MKTSQEAFEFIIAEFEQVVKKWLVWLQQHSQTNALELEKVFWQYFNPALGLAMQTSFEQLGPGYPARTIKCECGAELEAHRCQARNLVTTTGPLSLVRWYY